MMGVGFMMLRPCKPVFDHMRTLLDGDTSLTFPHQSAEMEFLEWYFR